MVARLAAITTCRWVIWWPLAHLLNGVQSEKALGSNCYVTQKKLNTGVGLSKTE